MGLFAAFTFLNAPNQPLAARIGAAVFASAFAIIGGGLIFGSIYGYSRLKKQSDIELAQPGSPWLWKPDWAAGRVESKNKASAIGWWLTAGLVNMLTLPAGMAGVSQWLEKRDPSYIALAGVGLIGLIVLFAAIRATLRLEHFGKTYFEMASLPFSPGRRLAGSIHVQLKTDAPHGVDVTLSCFRRVITSSGKNRTTQQVPLWEDSKNVSAASLMRGPMDTIIPIEFLLPGDALQTDHDNSSDQVIWMLKAKADVPGVDYSDEFELPVFRTSSSPAVTASATFGSETQAGSFARAQTTTTPSEASADVPEPAHHRVIVNDSPDGLEFRFRAGRNPGRAILVVILAAGISALFYAMLRIHPRPPMFAFVIVGLLDFFLLLAAIHAALSATRIVAGNGAISWRRSVLGMGSSHTIQVSDVDSILASTSIQQASSSGSTLYSLSLKSKSGKTYTLVDDIESRQEARWIVSQIEKRVGLRLNAQVEIKNSIYGPPPQPGSASPRGSLVSAAGVRTTGRTSNNWSQAIGTILFLGCAGFMGYTMMRMTHMRGGRSANNPGSTRTEAGGASSFARTAATKQASLEAVLAWPAQQQAEELMARAVEHSDAATQAIEENTSTWIGRIQLSGNLQQLEDRARYSSDLRVRRAEADLELALDS
jgi:hypothetical protein